MKHPLWILNSTLLLLVILTVLFIFFSRQSLPTWESLSVAQVQLPQTSASSEINQAGLAKIYEDDLFDTYQKPSMTEPEFGEMPPTPPTEKMPSMPPEPEPKFLEPLKVMLKGIIIFETDDSRNRAIIADTATQKEGLYKVGNTIEDAQLIKIFSNKVVLLRPNGQQEVLYLRQKDAVLDPAYAVISGWEDAAKKVSETEYLINPQEITRRITNLAQFIELLDLTTVYKQGQSIGCRIGKLQPNSFGQALGLETGDIILDINSIPAVDTPHRFEIYKLITSMKTKDTIRVHLLRNNNDMVFEYHIESFKKSSAEAPQVTQLPTHEVGDKQLDMLKERYKFAPTMNDIRTRERQNMLQRGRTPGPNESSNRTE